MALAASSGRLGVDASLELSSDEEGAFQMFPATRYIYVSVIFSCWHFQKINSRYSTNRMCISCLHKSFPTSHGICFPGAVVKGFVLRPVVTVLTVVAVARKMVVSVFPGAFENDFCRRGSPRSVPSVEMRCLDLFWTVKAIWAETEQIEKTRQKKTVYNIHTYVYMYIIYIYMIT